MLNLKDTVQLRLVVRSGTNASTHTLDTIVPVRELNFPDRGADIDPPVFDGVRYANLMREATPEAVEEALRLTSEFQEATAEYVAAKENAGQQSIADMLTRAVTDWVIATKPNGMNYSESMQDEAYVISPTEMNVSVTQRQDGSNVYLVSAVGTWGK